MTSEATSTEPIVPRAAPLTERAADLAARAGARLLRLPDPLLHPIRRRLAVARLPRHISDVLVVCYGNICRSPYAAAALLRELGPDAPTIRSVGFYGPDRPSPDAALAAAKQRGLSLDAHRSTLISADAAARADLIVVMEPQHVRQIRAQFGIDRRRIVMLGDFDPEPISTRAVPDPYGNEIAVFTACYERIERCVVELATAIREIRGRAAQIQPRAR